MTMSMELVDPAEVGMSTARLRDAGDLMQRQFDEGRSPMIAAVIARHGKVVFTKAIGDQRPGGPPLTIDSVFPLASQTKPLTAAVIMCLVERGLVGLNEPAAVLLPELEADHGEVMVNQLITHTSGWHEDDYVAAREDSLGDLIAGFDGDGDLLTHILLAGGWDVPRRLPQGEMMQYCNFNFTLLGEIVRRATGGTLDEAMREYLFDPIGMTSSTMIVGDDLGERMIERPSGIPWGPDHDFSEISFNDPSWAASDDGATGAHGPPTDYLRFGQMILDGGMVGDTRVLSRDAVRVMTTNQIPGIKCEAIGQQRVEASWGYGFSVAGFEPWPYFGAGTVSPASVRHGGAGGIYNWIDPHLGIVASYFEIVTEVDDFGLHTSWAAHRFEDVITAAALD